MSEETIKFKADSRGGFQLHFNNLEMLSSVKMVINVITKPIFKVKSQSFIGLKEYMDDGDVIEAGDFKKLYRILYHASQDHNGNVYRIERIDKASITNFDIEATKKGQRVRVVNRKSFEKIFNDFLIFDKKEDHE